MHRWTTIIFHVGRQLSAATIQKMIRRFEQRLWFNDDALCLKARQWRKRRAVDTRPIRCDACERNTRFESMRIEEQPYLTHPLSRFSTIYKRAFSAHKTSYKSPNQCTSNQCGQFISRTRLKTNACG